MVLISKRRVVIDVKFEHKDANSLEILSEPDFLYLCCKVGPFYIEIIKYKPDSVIQCNLKILEAQRF